MKNKNIIRIALMTGLILMVPFVAMQFTREVDWSPFDFVVAGLLLFGTGIVYELIAGKGGNTAYRIAAGVSIRTTFLLIWANLAVGLIGSGPNPANVMYMGVPLIGIIMACAGRFSSRGMTGALLATAIAQVIVPVMSVIIEKSRPGYNQVLPDIREILGVTAFFVTLWVVSALLFRHAATDPHSNVV